MKLFNTLVLTIFGVVVGIAQNSTVKGRIVDESNKPIPFATVEIVELNVATQTDNNGEFVFNNLKKGKQTLRASFIGFGNVSKTLNVDKDAEVTNFVLKQVDNSLSNITVYGKSNKNVKKLQNLTRLPLGIQDQVQNISIVSDAIIEEQGALTVTEAARNVAGVTQFSSYGGVKESMSIRGFRGTPILKNGVALDSDFRTAAGIVDMQGIESVQVIKGSAAINQGIGNGLGAAGGVINVVTKTPNFKNKREIGFRAGSYGQVRPTVDFEQVLDKKETVSFRFNGAYERNDGFRAYTGNDKYYLNPSITYKPDEKTTVTAELDYLESNAVPDLGTTNLGPDNVNKLYDMPHNKFLGYKDNYLKTNILSYALRVERELTDKLSLRVSAVTAVNRNDQENIGVSKNKKLGYDYLNRSMSKSNTKDENSVVQIDLVGKDFNTGGLKHTFQVGFDFRQTTVTSNSYDTYFNNKKLGRGDFIDTIYVLGDWSNDRPDGVTFGHKEETVITTPTIGFMAQDYIQVGEYVRALLGVRYSRLNGNNTENATVDRWNPIFGLIVSPTKNINVFGSYTTTTSLRQSNNQLASGGVGGPQDTKQFETGVKTSWFNEQLLFNVTYFNAKNSNLLAQVYDASGNAVTGIYEKAGNLNRQGVEIDLTGKITNNLQVMMGYAYLDAQYKDSPVYYEGSAPMNAPKHTANGWVNYQFDGSWKGLTVGAGAYFVGKRPVNEYSLTPNAAHGTMAGVEPFDMPDYTTINAQVSYSFKNATLRVFANNIFDNRGYTSYYRGGYINEIAPRNFAAQLTYRF
ncbi:TonB-dependent receptor [Myroides odoratimimus]|uniref:TonB-dependent siderophore receptor n=1 Tax=Myroides odoratimimus CIP 101113 TaxID=883154 RepID=A0AAV3F001_9FLAO|nr:MULTISPECIES: TonB-dependent receptor [Myroides]EHO05224.1 TonB-dependent siderophore receptor [Myroides odoratimimus CCUG 12901]EHO05922.1 TonB-dependent siderophore receptor [Myroides odoratimimus CIP 101113]EKB02805.1 TonB-dependent siderophore receptor [Myroides odoratimimus CCUG 3837]EPH08493.1 iron complex outermembrane recepter protein [Myroides odoratimimus CCUG 12700]MCA4792824.1 TonB-dependent receptor [Myroides odoratimimus]